MLLKQSITSHHKKSLQTTCLPVTSGILSAYWALYGQCSFIKRQLWSHNNARTVKGLGPPRAWRRSHRRCSLGWIDRLFSFAEFHKRSSTNALRTYAEWSMEVPTCSFWTESRETLLLRATDSSPEHGTDSVFVCELLVVPLLLRCGCDSQQGESLLCGNHWGLVGLRSKWKKPPQWTRLRKWWVSYCVLVQIQRILKDHLSADDWIEPKCCETLRRCKFRKW